MENKLTFVKEFGVHHASCNKTLRQKNNEVTAHKQESNHTSTTIDVNLPASRECVCVQIQTIQIKIR